MAVIYELRLEVDPATCLVKLLELIEHLSSVGEIEVTSKSVAAENSWIFTFHFVKWRGVADDKYLGDREFKSPVDTRKSSLKEIEDRVKAQILEAAESEILASRLVVNAMSGDECLSFGSIYEQFMTKRQAEQTGVYLQQKLEVLFNSLCGACAFPPIEYIVRDN
jgi:hypothetical protein